GSTGSLRAVEVRLPVPQVASPSVPEKPELRAVPRRGKLVSALLGLGLLGGAVYVQVSHARQPALPMRAAVAPPPVIARSVELSPAAVASPAPTPSDVVAPEATPVVHDERALGFAMRWGTKQAELCHQRGGSAGRTVRVDLTFEPNGKVSRAALNGEEAPNSAEDRCILGQFRGVMIPRFAGEAVAITREIKLR
ncbi:MAG TPA: hypothetical protein VFQ35_01900, partial [Polyangiaceae bacterium]|nr:hypothetical protein [Polyangiaceae bacterium]